MVGPYTAGQLAEAMPRVRKILASTQNVIIESNSVMRFLKPDLYLTVLDPETADFKTSAQTFLDRADAVLLHASDVRGKHSQAGAAVAPPTWERVSLKPVLKRPIFRITPANYVTSEVVEFVRGKFALASR